MKKITILFVTILVITAGLFAQNQIISLGNSSNHLNQTALIFQNDNQIVLKFNLNQLELIELETGYGNAFIPIADKAPLMLQEGAPELFYFTTSFIIPDRGSSELEISYGQYQDFENIEIAPSKGNLLRSIDPKTVPFVQGEVYQMDAFFPGTLASLREPFIMRDVRGQSLDVYPVQYNPVTKILRIYSEITVTVNNTQNEGVNEFTNQKRHQTIDPQFSQMYNNLFINSSVVQQRGYPTGEEGELLIICHPAFMEEMKPYIDWKQTIGRKTNMVSTAETGTTYTAIKSFIQNYYNNNNLAYVLLVGDVAQIPVYSFTSGYQTCYSDIYYVQSGTYLDALIGRMSAESVNDVKTQVQRSIWYERDINTADSWIPKASGIAVSEGGPGQGGHDGQEADYVHMNKIRTRLISYGYDPVYQDYYGSTGVPPTSNATISQHINDGLSMINYCNHGDVTMWTPTYGTNYSNAQVNQLQNAGKLPYIFSVACLNGKFPNATCFAEAWLRAQQGGAPTGAIAAFMATISISWEPPMTAQDEFVNICMDLPSQYSGAQPGIKRTIAGAMLNASQKMRMVHGGGSNGDYCSWTVFGDPTLMFRTKTPEEMTVSFLPVSLGATEFTVVCDVDGAMATVSYRDENDDVIILGTAIVTDGTAELVFEEPVSDDMELTLAITAFNKVTYLNTIFIGEAPELFPPQNLTYKVEKANHVILNWDLPEEGKPLTVKGYNVYRGDTQINPELIDETTYTDIVPANGEYKYMVTASYGASLESEPTEPIYVIIDGMCVAISNAITVEQTEGPNILVSWEAPEYEGTELAGYNLFRDDEQINEEMIPATELSYLDENLEPEIEYCYQVEVVYNDCEEILKTDAECILLVSVKEFHGVQFTIYPNPASSELNITGNAAPTYICIFNSMGQIMYETEQCKANMKISVATLRNGIYFIRIDSELGSVSRKVLVRN